MQDYVPKSGKNLACMLTRFLQDLGKILERSCIKSWQDLGKIFDRASSQQKILSQLALLMLLVYDKHRGQGFCTLSAFILMAVVIKGTTSTLEK